MGKSSENKIPDLSADWGKDERNGLPYAGWAVQEFLKKFCQKSVDNEENKIGAFYFDTASMKFYTFRNEEDKDNFIANGDVSLILSSQDIVFGGTQRKLTIINKMGSNNIYFTTNSKKAEITVGFESKEKDFNAQEWTDVIEDAYFTVSVDKGYQGNYIKIIDNVLVRHGETLTFDVFNYISSGSNRVKVTAVGIVSEQTGSYGYSVTLTSMYLSPSKFGWYIPFIEGEPYNLGGMNIGGALQKKLFIKISNESGYSAQYEENIGTATYITNPYYYTDLQFPNAGTGIYNVELWLDADGLQSEHLSYNIMCVAKSDKNTAKLCCISDALKEVVNYSDNTLFNFAVYNGGSISASPHIKLTSIVNTNPSVILDEDLTNVSTSVAIPYKYNLEIETEESNIKLDAVLSFGVEQKVLFNVDNSASYPATTGALVYINAATRNNTQINKTDIINEINKGTITAEWTNMAWVDGTDGWTIDDAGRKCLFMPARTKANINLKPLQSVGNGKTIEFTFKVSNASDYEESIITVCDAPTSPTFRGIRIRPNNILAHSRDLNTDDANQSYGIPEDTLINVCVSIIRNYKTNYGNICIIYVNGVRKKEFAFTNADSWITEANVILGSETADMYLYNIRVYDKGFGTQDALQNYVASLPNSLDKRKAYELMHTVIDDSFNIDYDRTKVVANVVTIEMLDGGEIPHYGLSKEYKAQCNLEVSWNKNPEWNWGIDNITIEGQGTTSMNYFRWNLRWRLDKSEGFTIHLPDGGTSQDDTLWFDGEDNHPKLSRMTAKINYASSMQSHKIGATAMFNDVHHHLGLDNEAGGRVAVFQHPFYFFEKKKIEGTEQYTYSFIGLFTFGADKGDKYTFGYKDPAIKDTLLVLEGLDHPIKSVGMDYPWSELKYVADEESLCVDKGNNNYDAAWEVSQSGSAESEEEIQSKLDTEFKPAYEVAYNNSTMIIGTDETLETINADVDAWGQRTDEKGNAYQRYEFWIDGEYELYYLSKKTNKYVKNGINLLTQLGLSTEDLSGLDIKGKNELFKQKRREKFKSEMGNYWHLDDCLYCYCFLLLVGATDNFKKNSYPYKLGTLSSGSRWRWRQDDLDTLFDIDNQGLAVKGYSIEAHDWTDSSKTAYVFKGEDSVFWTLLGECFDIEAKAMGKKILGAMYEMSSTGTNTVDRLMGFMQKYFWNNAQNYFTKSAYNSDAEYKYEEAWPKYASGDYDVDVHPLSQSLGDHLEAEMLWARQRLIYMMSKWGYGPFAQYTDSSLGRINFRTQLAQSFKLTPFMDLYPCILSGQGATHASPDRVLSGEEVTISGAGGTNTNVYIMAADELESIGDLSTLTVDAASNAGIAIASKRLKTVKVGDEVAEKVTSNLQQLNIGQCNSLVSVDARNLKSLTGTVDLSRCPRLVEALFSGTDVRSITLASGSKIVKLQLSDATTVLELLNLQKLQELEYSDLSKVEFFRIENVGQINPFEKLKEVYNLDDSALKDIRLIGFEYTGDAADLDILANIANDKDKDGEPHSYNGITADGIPQEDLLPIVEGNITVEGNVYQDSVDTIKELFPNLTLDITGEYYFRFKDPEVARVLSSSIGDGTGVFVDTISTIGNRKINFYNNKVIETFDEFEKFTGITNTENNTDNGMFRGCTNLKSIKLPNSITSIASYSFNGCSNLSYFIIPESVTSIGYTSFTNCVNFSGDLNLPNLEKIGNAAFKNSGITSISNLGKLRILTSTYASSEYTFGMCNSLKTVILPDTLEEIGNSAFKNSKLLTTVTFPNGLKIIRGSAFSQCTSLTGEINLPNLETLEKMAFKETNITKVVNLGKIKVLPSSGNGQAFMFGSCKSLESVVLPDTLEEIGSSAFYQCTSLTSINLPQSLKIISTDAFSSIKNALPEEINLPNLEDLGGGCFYQSAIKYVTNLGKITELKKSNVGTFASCKSLISVVLPETLTSIIGDTFSECSELISINIPDSLISMGNGVFYACTLLPKIDIPNSVTSIGGQAFEYCRGLKDAIIRATTPPTLGSAAFNSTHADLKIYVPDDSVEAYKAATNWSNYASKIHPLSEYVEQ